MNPLPSRTLPEHFRYSREGVLELDVEGPLARHRVYQLIVIVHRFHPANVGSLLPKHPHYLYTIAAVLKDFRHWSVWVSIPLMVYSLVGRGVALRNSRMSLILGSIRPQATPIAPILIASTLLGQGSVNIRLG